MKNHFVHIKIIIITIIIKWGTTKCNVVDDLQMIWRTASPGLVRKVWVLFSTNVSQHLFHLRFHP